MNNDFLTPSVVTPVKIGDFILYIYAYRTVNQSEMKLAAKQWLLNFHKKSFPQKGTGKIITTFGLDPE